MQFCPLVPYSGSLGYERYELEHQLNNVYSHQWAQDVKIFIVCPHVLNASQPEL